MSSDLQSPSHESLSPLSHAIWDAKYRLKHADGAPIDMTLADTWRRVADAAASVEAPEARSAWSQTFYDAMNGFGFLPGGRILAGAGTGREVTLFNCFVMGRIDDDLGAIFDEVKAAATTMQQGGGIGHDFSTLRPRGALVASIGADASGPVSFMDVWDAMCRTIMSAGARRGAMMGTMRCDHPDIEAFVDAKRDPQKLRNFNLSVLVSDAFMAAVRKDDAWPLVFAGKTYRTVRARDLWQRIMRATYDYAEPGVIFIDRINAQNNLSYCETINATNPCGEQPLPPYGACLLGSINLSALVRDPFTDRARLDEGRLSALVRTAVRFLDNIIDVSGYPLVQQRAEALAKRRLGLGVTGLADALIMVGARYDHEEGRATAARWLGVLQHEAYRASVALAAEKGVFPLYDRDAVLQAPGVQRLPPSVREAIARDGMRNGLVTSIAPTGTISLLAGNVSSGIEPVFAWRYDRRLLQPEGSHREVRVEDAALARLRAACGDDAAEGRLPDAFISAQDLAPHDHIAMQAALQPHVDSAISKTINCPADLPFDAFEEVYLAAYDQGLKGCTTFRPNAVTGSVLATVADDADGDSRTTASEATTGAATEAATVPAAREAGVTPGALQVIADTGPVETGTGPWSAEKGETAEAAFGAATSPAAGEWPPSVATPPADASAARPAAGSASARPGSGMGEAAVIYMAEPLARANVLIGRTYKLRWPGNDHALYITINDIEEGDRARPFEIFINTKNLEHHAWTVALTRMISAVFRRGGDVSFVVEELRAIYDPQGGHFVGGRYVPSLIAAIGDVIAQHMRAIGFLRDAPGEGVGSGTGASANAADTAEAKAGARARDGRAETASKASSASGRHLAGPRVREAPGRQGSSSRPRASMTLARAAGSSREPTADRHAPDLSEPALRTTAAGAGVPAPASDGAVRTEAFPDGVGPQVPASGTRKFCPRCQHPGLIAQEGCLMCPQCGYARCG
ncbi:MAG: adenosylcobalamin-dependent ribonucleoside-diphosphate reductase [Pseudomonadota bacterium]